MKGTMAFPSCQVGEKIERQRATTSEGLIHPFNRLPLENPLLPPQMVLEGYRVPMPGWLLFLPMSMSLSWDCKCLKDSSHFLPLSLPGD